MSGCRQKNQQKNTKNLIRLGEFKIEDVMPFIENSFEFDPKREYEVNGVKYLVKMNSQRYFTFQKSMNCVSCGIAGTKFFLERFRSDESPHFNLYAEEDGELILMTKDHIVPKSLGGKDYVSNYQTMCSICNNLKGSSNLTPEEIKKIRDHYNQNKNDSRFKGKSIEFFRMDFMNK
jgi:hypothetical protein